MHEYLDLAAETGYFDDPRILYDLTPNWQQLYLAQALEDKGVIPWGYVLRASGYAASVIIASLSVALVLFEDRELG